ncbi:MAG: LssY C-terminal domain-containing protein [Candidatus Saccharibacteria bacterium]|nr:LssY C-terminal domain-containing protein [Candidatus Saccharibacteria bacterium]
MVSILVRFFKRFAVLIPGLAVAYFVTVGVYPFLDRNTPTAFAVLVAYIIAAYIFIPLLLRVIRFFIRPKHIPLYCVTPDGFASDPINIGIEGTREQIIKAMTEAGWHLADKRTVRTVGKMVISYILKRPYLNAPFSNLFLFGRRQDIGFQLPVKNQPNHRHHVRFWANQPKLPKDVEADLKFWQKHTPGNAPSKPVLWVGAASRDVGLAIIRHNAQFTHMIDPDTNAERNLIAKHLKQTNLVKETRSVKLGEPYSLVNRVLRGKLHADGKMTILTLK